MGDHDDNIGVIIIVLSKLMFVIGVSGHVGADTCKVHLSQGDVSKS
jgi:hypothetical protein